MKFRTATAGAALVIGAMTAAVGTANAAPAPKPAKDVIDYSVKLVDKAVVATLQGGTFQVVQKPGLTPQAKPQQIINVKDKAGKIAMEMPVDYRISGVQIPVVPVVKENGRVLQLTPQKPAAAKITKETVVAQPIVSPKAESVASAQPEPQPKAQAKPQAKDIASPQEDNAAMTDFATKFGLATGIGSFVGMAIGAVVGCIFGLPLFGVGCLAGIPVGATLGGVIGTIAAGGPTLVAAGMDLINTMQKPAGKTKWAQAVGVTPTPKAQSAQK
ncbi:hypothetical protein [Nocardia miyunensis]|uniref:hypothetical protein n=1 Tax=Nocardia miyunensis TaxID=282684 RepID=UPI0008329F4C|nr:hypothetical protein [Nocardia miyunensis]